MASNCCDKQDDDDAGRRRLGDNDLVVSTTWKTTRMTRLRCRGWMEQKIDR